MPRRASDHALRRLVVELADKRNEDIRGVLDALEVRHRLTVEQLLADYAGQGTEALAIVGSGDLHPAHGFSPWLADRIESGEVPGAERAAIAPAALAALRACAAALQPAIMQPASRGLSLIERLQQSMFGPGRAH